MRIGKVAYLLVERLGGRELHLDARVHSERDDELLANGCHAWMVV